MKKLILFKHRINHYDDFKSLEPGWGVELDLRSNIFKNGEIQVTHEPWGPGVLFSDWLNEYAKLSQPGPLILNTKEAGLEARILELLSAKKINNYFFLDTALPTLVKWTTQHKNKNFAVRLSHFEPPEFVEKFSGLVEWLWVDCFEGRPVDPDWLIELQGEFKICLVSPELQNKDVSLIADFRKLLAPFADAVCTKRPELWID